jgi:lysophospholipase L1-like esterase
MIRIVVSGFIGMMLLGIINTSHAQAKSKLVGNLDNGKSQVIVAYGTSLTASGGWVRQLSKVLKKRYPNLTTVINSGGAGKWSKWGIDNLDKLVIQQKPDTVFLEFCINDSVERFHCSVGQARKNLETMITRILKQNPKCEIILMTMTPGNKYPPGHRSHRKDIELYYAMYRAVAKERGLMLIDHYPNWIALQTKHKKLFAKYVPDTIHPTPTGCKKIVTPVIIKALGIIYGD